MVNTAISFITKNAIPLAIGALAGALGIKGAEYGYEYGKARAKKQAKPRAEKHAKTGRRGRPPKSSKSSVL